MLVLVTGAAGRLGSATCEQLTAAGIEFRAADAHSRKDIGYRIAVENLLTPEACYRLVEGCDAVVHLANRPGEQSGSAQAIYGENCTMNINVFQAAMELGIKKIIFASSVQAIIGSRHTGEAATRPSVHAYLPADGDSPTNPGNHYGASKVAGEQLLKYFVEHRALESGVSLRFPALMRTEWLDGLRHHFNINSMWQEEYIDELATWLTYSDGARLIAAALKATLPGYRCYFPTSPTLRYDSTPKEFIHRFYSSVPLRKPIDEIHSLVDTSRITAETGWTPIDHLPTTTQPAQPK